MKRFLIALLLIPTVQIYAPAAKSMHLEAKSIHGYPLSYIQPQFPNYSQNALTNSAASDTQVAADLAAQQAAAQAQADAQAAYEAQQQALANINADPRAYAQTQVPASQWGCLDALWNQESGWNANAVNSSSGAYGIPQALGHGDVYALGDVQAQVAWGLNYIYQSYGSPCAAENHELSYNWY